MRLGDADREELFRQLAAHTAAGRLSSEELERRLSEVAAAETFAQAAEVMADLPPAGPASRAGSPWGAAGRHGEASSPQAGWRATAERFRDPGSGRIVRVWRDPGGGRHYVPESHRD